MPESARGFNPIVAVTSLTIKVPSSTRTPAGSVITISFPSGSIAVCVVRVTDVGATVTVEPLIGEVVISELAEAVDMPINPKIAALAKNPVILEIFTYVPFVALPLIRANRLTSLDLASTPWWGVSPRFGVTVPTYQYACNACAHEFEVFQSFSDASLTQCPECKGEIRKVYSAVGVVFKGSGFYKTDSAAKKTTTESSKPTPAPAAAPAAKAD